MRAIAYRSMMMAAAFACGLAAAGCGDDVVAYSETVSLKLDGIKAGEVSQGTASADKNVNTEDKNPYGAFLKTARSRLGRDPSGVEVVSLLVSVHPDSKNVVNLEQVFADFEVYLATSDTVVTIGHVTGPTGTSVVVPVADPIDYEPVLARMLDGNFKMGVRGNVVASPPDGFELKLTIDTKFRALE
ncbi:MAG: hypothetical protein U1F43_23555 [Myxococcota bacterium]